jgi:hypothetical protein
VQQHQAVAAREVEQPIDVACLAETRLVADVS